MSPTTSFIVAIVGIVLALTGVYFAVEWNYANGIVVAPPLAAVAMAGIPAVPAANIPVNQATTTTVQVPVANSANTFTGTLVYFNQQSHIVPYLTYDGGHGVVSKALAFQNASICVTGVEAPCPDDLNAIEQEFGTGPVTITGTVDDESIIVSRIVAVH